MLTCTACARSIDVAGARWCPHCGASLAEAETQSAAGATSPQPPLGDARFPPGLLFASRYRIVSLLGCGAMGEVYRADDLKLGQAIALKLCLPMIVTGVVRDKVDPFPGRRTAEFRSH